MSVITFRARASTASTFLSWTLPVTAATSSPSVRPKTEYGFFRGVPLSSANSRTTVIRVSIRGVSRFFGSSDRTTATVTVTVASPVGPRSSFWSSNFALSNSVIRSNPPCALPGAALTSGPVILVIFAVRHAAATSFAALSRTLPRSSSPPATVTAGNRQRARNAPDQHRFMDRLSLHCLDARRMSVFAPHSGLMVAVFPTCPADCLKRKGSVRYKPTNSRLLGASWNSNELLSRLRQADPEAQNEFIRRYRGTARAAAPIRGRHTLQNHVDSEDLAQSVIFRALVNICGGLPVRSEAHLQNILRQMARWRLLDYARTAGSRPAVVHAEYQVEPNPTSVDRRAVELIEQLESRLTPRQLEVWQAWVDGYSATETASKMKTSPTKIYNERPQIEQIFLEIDPPRR